MVDQADYGVEKPTVASRIVSAVLLILVGIVYGVLGTIAHQTTVTIAGVSIPIGLILAVVGASALLVGLRLIQVGRMLLLLCALGMLLTIFVLSLKSAGGSILIPAGVPGTIWTIVPTIVAAITLAWPTLPPKQV